MGGDPIGRMIHDRARSGRKAMGTEWESEKAPERAAKAAQLHASNVKTALLGALGSRVGAGLLGMGAKGGGAGFGQGLARKAGTMMMKNPRMAGGLIAGGAGAAAFGAGRASKGE
jgi:hypothetical protein